MKERLAILSVGIAIAAFVFLGFAVWSTSKTDCNRTKGIVVGIYTILDRSSERTQQYVDEGIITQRQADEAKAENRRVRAYITLPHC